MVSDWLLDQLPLWERRLLKEECPNVDWKVACSKGTEGCVMSGEHKICYGNDWEDTYRLPIGVDKEE